MPLLGTATTGRGGGDADGGDADSSGDGDSGGRGDGDGDGDGGGDRSGGCGDAVVRCSHRFISSTRVAPPYVPLLYVTIQCRLVAPLRPQSRWYFQQPPLP